MDGYPEIYPESVAYADLDSDAVPASAGAPLGGGFQSSGGYAGSRPIEIRKEFPETWLFENLDFKER